MPNPEPQAAPGKELTLATQLFRFIVTGAFSGVIDFGLTALLQFGLDWAPWPAKAVGWLAGTITAYLINRRWTFNADHSTKRFIAVALLYLATFGVQTGIYAGLLAWWGETGFTSLAAYVVAQGTATVINFAVQRAFIFKLEAEKPTPAS